MLKQVLQSLTFSFTSAMLRLSSATGLARVEKEEGEPRRALPSDAGQF